MRGGWGEVSFENLARLAGLGRSDSEGDGSRSGGIGDPDELSRCSGYKLNDSGPKQSEQEQIGKMMKKEENEKKKGC